MLPNAALLDFVYLNFPADYLECIMMIPQAEIDNNPNITAADQNPYVQS